MVAAGGASGQLVRGIGSTGGAVEVTSGVDDWSSEKVLAPLNESLESTVDVGVVEALVGSDVVGGVFGEIGGVLELGTSVVLELGAEGGVCGVTLALGGGGGTTEGATDAGGFGVDTEDEGAVALVLLPVEQPHTATTKPSAEARTCRRPLRGATLRHPMREVKAECARGVGIVMVISGNKRRDH